MSYPAEPVAEGLAHEQLEMTVSEIDPSRVSAVISIDNAAPGCYVYGARIDDHCEYLEKLTKFVTRNHTVSRYELQEIRIPLKLTSFFVGRDQYFLTSYEGMTRIKTSALELVRACALAHAATPTHPTTQYNLRVLTQVFSDIQHLTSRIRYDSPLREQL